MARETILRMKNIVKDYPGCRGLDHIDFSIHEGEVVAVIGPSGSGKSTLLKCIHTPDMITSGEIERKDEAWLISHPPRLIPYMTCIRNITRPRIKTHREPKKKIDQEAKELLETMGLTSIEKAYPAQLTEEEKQRVAIAKALFTRPGILLFDDLTPTLGQKANNRILQQIKVPAKEGRTMIVVTSKPDFIREAADRVIFMKDGKITEEKTLRGIFDPSEFMLPPET